MDVKSHLKNIKYLKKIADLSIKRNTKVWLVGGFLRDKILKRKKDFIDVDFCVEKDTLKFVKALSKLLSLKYIVLDDTQQSYRIFIKNKSKVYTYDFTAIRGNDIIEDLSKRDFTINSIAVDINDKKFTLLDPHQGVCDLNQGIIRSLSADVFFDDPLRVLRAFSFMANYGFKIKTTTEKAIVKYKAYLKDVSGERIREEIFKIFSTSTCYKTVRAMDRLAVLDEIFPEIKECRKVIQGDYHHLDVWGHTLETIRQFERLYKQQIETKPEVLGHLSRSLKTAVSKVTLLRLACLFHDIGKPAAKLETEKKIIFHSHEKIGRDITEKICQRLRFSAREREFLKKCVYWHLRPGYLADQETLSKRAVYRFFRDTGIDGVAVILLSLADWRATRGPLINYSKRRRHERVMLGLIDFHLSEKKKKPLPKLVNGNDIMRKFKVKQGKLVGMILEKIKEEQSVGGIRNKTEAYALAKRVIVRAREVIE
ncbi:MAG: HD domain-containing protein [Candidatus Omnitrophica bacterium]|nr:HD domain-containing protein [Candidatus Omnitrophota bacterium]